MKKVLSIILAVLTLHLACFAGPGDFTAEAARALVNPSPQAANSVFTGGITNIDEVATQITTLTTNITTLNSEVTLLQDNHSALLTNFQDAIRELATLRGTITFTFTNNTTVPSTIAELNTFLFTTYPPVISVIFGPNA
ncbi:MAG: hypothetical protein WCG05_00990 [Alphaproteobacteria bacterium]